MAVITFLENAAFTDATARDWLGWRFEANQTRILYTFPQGPGGPPLAHSRFSQYDITTSNTASWNTWSLDFFGSPRVYDSAQQHRLPDGGFQSIPGTGTVAELRAYSAGTVLASGNIQNGPEFVRVTGLSVDLNTLWTYPTADFEGYVANLVAQFGGGNDTFHGSSRGDLINSYGGNDTINGNGGADRIDGGAGFDTLNGGAGDDIFFLRDTSSGIFDLVSEEANGGFDTVWVGLVGAVNFYQLAPNVEQSVISNASDGFLLRGNEGDNYLFGNVGADRLSGNDGSDRLNGGGGYDVLTGGGGNDVFELADVGLIRVGGNILGEAYDDVEEAAGGGLDTVRVGWQQSSLFGPFTSYELTENVENGAVTGTRAFDLIGNAGNNSLDGNDADNTLNGAGGNDFIDGNRGDDTLVGGPGNDLYVLEDLTTVYFNGVPAAEFYDEVVETVGGGNDTVWVARLPSSVLVGSFVASYTLGANVENGFVIGSGDYDIHGNELDNVLVGNGQVNTLVGYGGFDVIEGGAGDDWIFGGNGGGELDGGAGRDRVDGGLHDDIIHGGDGDDELRLGHGTNHGYGDAGNDIVAADSGNDRIDGGAGADTMRGRGGNDVYVVDNEGDVVDEGASGSGGIDRVESTITFSLNGNANVLGMVENITLLGASDIWAIGNALANVLTGNAGNNLLNGLAGADTLTGGAGNDSYYVDNAGDRVIETANGGDDIVVAYVDYTLAVGVQVETLQAAGFLTTNPINLRGNEFGQRLYGTAGTNILHGGAGADSLYGRNGNDTYYVDNAGDRVFEVAGGGTDAVFANASFALAAGQEVELLGTTSAAGTAAINLTGNETGQRINGNNGNNVIYGGAGNDLLVGYGGNDNIEGQNGADTLKGVAGIDKFVFRQSLVATSGADHISDFGSDDFVYFDTTSVVGPLDPAAFVVGANALDANDRFIYYAPYKALYFDPDGAGGAAKVLFAVFDNGYAPTAADIVLF